MLHLFLLLVLVEHKQYAVSCPLYLLCCCDQTLSPIRYKRLFIPSDSPVICACLLAVLLSVSLCGLAVCSLTHCFLTKVFVFYWNCKASPSGMSFCENHFLPFLGVYSPSLLPFVSESLLRTFFPIYPSLSPVSFALAWYSSIKE